MLDIEYLKKLRREHAVAILYATAYYMNCTPLEREEDLDKLSDSYQVCLSASLILRTRELDNFCISITDKADHKKYSIYFRDKDAKQIYFLLNLSKVSYSDFVSILKSSAELDSKSSNSYCCTANLVIDKIGNAYYFNNGSGNGKQRSFDRVLRDTTKELKHKKKEEEKGRERV